MEGRKETFSVRLFPPLRDFCVRGKAVGRDALPRVRRKAKLGRVSADLI